MQQVEGTRSARSKDGDGSKAGDSSDRNIERALYLQRHLRRGGDGEAEQN